MNVKELEINANKIDKLVSETVISDNPETTSPILDGIINLDRYTKAKYKILWILKEPYDDVEDGIPCGGGWCLREFINSTNKIEDFKHGRKTFEPIIHTTYGILNDFISWNEMPYVHHDPTMLEAFKSTAYINVKKLPGFTTSDNGVIAQAYQKYKEVLLAQINCYDPDIIIGCSTLKHFFSDLDLSKETMLFNHSNSYSIKNKRILIDAYHPAQRASSTGVSPEQYSDDIINAVKIWASSRS